MIFNISNNRKKIIVVIKVENEARKINNEINHDIFQKFKSYGVSKDENDVLTFQKSINFIIY